MRHSPDKRTQAGSIPAIPTISRGNSHVAQRPVHRKVRAWPAARGLRGTTRVQIHETVRKLAGYSSGHHLLGRRITAFATASEAVTTWFDSRLPNHSMTMILAARTRIANPLVGLPPFRFDSGHRLHLGLGQAARAEPPRAREPSRERPRALPGPSRCSAAGSAPRSGRGGREFEPHHLDHSPRTSRRPGGWPLKPTVPSSTLGSSSINRGEADRKAPRSYRDRREFDSPRRDHSSSCRKTGIRLFGVQETARSTRASSTISPEGGSSETIVQEEPGKDHRVNPDPRVSRHPSAWKPKKAGANPAWGFIFAARVRVVERLLAMQEVSGFDSRWLLHPRRVTRPSRVSGESEVPESKRRGPVFARRPDPFMPRSPQWRGPGFVFRSWQVRSLSWAPFYAGEAQANVRALGMGEVAGLRPASGTITRDWPSVPGICLPSRTEGLDSLIPLHLALVAHREEHSSCKREAIRSSRIGGTTPSGGRRGARTPRLHRVRELTPSSSRGDGDQHDFRRVAQWQSAGVTRQTRWFDSSRADHFKGLRTGYRKSSHDILAGFEFRAIHHSFGGITQLVECLLCKQDATGSNPVVSTITGL